jgi:hypothetical protein
MAELVLIALSAAGGSALTYIVWCLATQNGERTRDRRCWWCGAKRRSYYAQRHHRDDENVVKLRCAGGYGSGSGMRGGQ